MRRWRLTYQVWFLISPASNFQLHDLALIVSIVPCSSLPSEVEVVSMEAMEIAPSRENNSRRLVVFSTSNWTLNEAIVIGIQGESDVAWLCIDGHVIDHNLGGDYKYLRYGGLKKGDRRWLKNRCLEHYCRNIVTVFTWTFLF
ncbi:hypothetical protein LWI28_009848 [Acer negundo]|uniref:Uncharacterized protein n=1 Tax=Acer negundo TaxID=4023 RepID=A0AAD5NJ94_ACENE|nr:hypothetical protein LWI28_009848 [Acer negundo]